VLNLLSLEEAAKQLHLSIHTLRAWKIQKRFPIVKLGRRILVKQEVIESLVEENIIKAEKGE